jgi:hypothetical protein
VSTRREHARANHIFTLGHVLRDFQRIVASREAIVAALPQKFAASPHMWNDIGHIVQDAQWCRYMLQERLDYNLMGSWCPKCEFSVGHDLLEEVRWYGMKADAWSHAVNVLMGVGEGSQGFEGG